MSASLWEIGAEMRDLEAELVRLAEEEPYTDEEREELLQEAFDEWLIFGDNFNNKAEQVASYIRQQEAIAKARKEEAKRIQELAKQTENKAIRLRKYLLTQMQLSNINKIEGITTKISLRKKPASVELLVEPDELPEYFQKITIKANLSELKAAITTGKYDVSEFAKLSKTAEYSLVIK